MNKRTLFILLVIASCSVWSQSNTYSDSCSIKKNGVYYASLDKETNIYLRFYENDTVVTTSSMNNVKKAATYIAKELGDKLMRGKYFINPSSCNIRVKAKNDFGKVKMDGIISGDKLVLAVINLDDRTASDFVFNFYPIAKP